MKNLIRELLYLIKKDDYANKKTKNLLIVGCSLSFVIILFIIAVGLYFMKPMLGFILANVPVLNEILFTNLRNVILPYLKEDILGMLTGLINTTNAEELKLIINSYFDQLLTYKNIGFDSFLKFTNEIKQTLLDGQITQPELELLKKFIVN